MIILEKDDLIIKNADLSQKNERLKLMNTSSDNHNKLTSTNSLDMNSYRLNSVHSVIRKNIYLIRI